MALPSLTDYDAYEWGCSLTLTMTHMSGAALLRLSLPSAVQPVLQLLHGGWDDVPGTSPVALHTPQRTGVRGSVVFIRDKPDLQPVIIV